MEQIKAFLDTVKPAHRQSHQNLTIFPLLAPDGNAPEYLTLEEAMEQQLVKVTEISQSGSVHLLNLINVGEKNVLVLEGEELVGAKQNRIVNSTFLIAGRTEVVIPVSCVEQGRWHYRSPIFVYGKKLMPADLRGQHQRQVSRHIRAGRGFESDQGLIWDNLARAAHRLEVDSPSAAMADIYEQHTNGLGRYADAFRPVDCQVGAVVAVNGRIVGLDCFGYHHTLARFFGKLIHSYAFDALARYGGKMETNVPPEKARRFLDSIKKCRGERCPSLCLGLNVRFESRQLSGSALVYNGCVLHFSAFGKAAEFSPPGLGTAGFSRRRRFQED